VIARVRRGAGLTESIEAATPDLVPADEGAYERILVPIKLGPIGEEMLATAIKLAEERGGTILNMSWDHVVTGMAGDDPQLFSAVKGGVLAFSKSLARRLAPDVRVNILCPGWIETSFGEQADRDFHRSVADATPMGRWGRPQDVADAALYLASPEAAFVTGQAINVNGGVL
jgi:3-oxoacyl-[acyl-carrier protein] reductase